MEQAFRYLSMLLSQVVHHPSKKGSLRERLQILSLEFSERYEGILIDFDTQTFSTFTTLRDLVVFFDLYHEKKFQSALETLAKLKLVPMSMNELDICLHNFKR